MSTSFYEDIATIASKHIKKDRDVDYDVILQTLHESLGDYSAISLGKWNKGFMEGEDLYQMFTKKIFGLPERVVNGYGEEMFIDKNHFLIQVFRIPMTEPCTLLNLLRISFYNGLLQPGLKQIDFPEGIVKTYNNMDIPSIINYVNRDTYNAVVDKIPKEHIKKVLSAISRT